MSNCENDDPFDSIVMIENKACEEGYNKGFQEGKKMGYVEGTSLGKSKGSELAQELGVYYGICQCALNMHETEIISHKHQRRVVSQLKALINDIQGLVLQDNVHVLIASMDDIKSRFKKLESVLQLKVDKTTSQSSKLSF
uniref:Oral cancer-overexpressed protein 1-like n=1 Tax=Phallusia mammillata TaxID=59560 RepID=A0A6F9DJD7_9ASCI|nr:oral cancer-overexpressed protein 1-like [Phallusia mammillata]